MTVLIEYPKQTKENNEVFFEKKDKELTELDWAKWGGWWDTDGSFSTLKREATLRLKDRQPVELFSKIFETSLIMSITKTITPEPYRYEYTTTMYNATLRNEKAVWFTKNIHPYLLKGAKKDYSAKLLGYQPQSKDIETWTQEEITNYLATAAEGDGQYRLKGRNNKSIEIGLYSNDSQYLSNVQNLVNKLGVISRLVEHKTYQTQEGIRTMYALYFLCSRRNPENLPFFKNLIKDNVMTLDRKKQKVQEFLGAMPR